VLKFQGSIVHVHDFIELRFYDEITESWNLINKRQRPMFNNQ